MKAIVVGAGLAGLAAARRLTQANWDVTVLEAGEAVGGRTTSFHQDGYQLEKGATQLSTGYQAYLALAKEVGLADAIVPCGNTIMLMRAGRLYPIDGTKPLRALLSGALSWRSKLRMVRAVRDYRAIQPPLDVLDVSASAALDTESAEVYALRRLNREIFDTVIDPLIRCYTINRGTKVSALEWHSALANLAGRRMLALSGGIQRLAKHLASELAVQVNVPVAQVRRQAGGVVVTLQSREALDADACVIATRFPEAEAMAPDLHDALAPLAGKLRYNRAVNVSLGYARKPHTDALGLLVPTIEHPQIGLVWLDHNKLAETAPPGHALITCYFEESGIDSVQPPTDSRFVNIADAFVRKLFPEVAGSRDMAAVVRWERAIPNPAPGVYKAIAEMKRRLNAADPIQLAGDYFTCTGQNSAIHWGQRAAANIVSHLGRTNTPPVAS